MRTTGAQGRHAAGPTGGRHRGSTVVAEGLTKRFGRVRAVTDVSFAVEPGQVTGFLGPNGEGKTTTLRMVLGLVRSNAGSSTVDGVAYRDLRSPLATVGAALDGSGANVGRTGRDHLRWLVADGSIPVKRCDEVLALTGLSDAARRKVGGYSTGMRQRLALATALLGDPGVLVLDEPANGLDPAGIAWLRGFLRTLAEEGRTVLVSSHVLSEVEQTVDHVVVLAAGRVAYVGDLPGLAGRPGVLVDSPDRAGLVTALDAAGLGARPDHGRALLVHRGPTGVEVRTTEVGAAAAAAGVALSHLAPDAQRLEDAFLRTVAAPRRPPGEGAPSRPAPSRPACSRPARSRPVPRRSPRERHRRHAGRRGPRRGGQGHHDLGVVGAAGDSAGPGGDERGAVRRPHLPGGATPGPGRPGQGGRRRRSSPAGSAFSTGSRSRRRPSP